MFEGIIGWVEERRRRKETLNDRYGTQVSRFSTIFSKTNRKRRKNAQAEYDADILRYWSLRSDISILKKDLMKICDWFVNKRRDRSEEDKKRAEMRDIEVQLEKKQEELAHELKDRLDKNAWILKKRMKKRHTFVPWWNSFELTVASELDPDFYEDLDDRYTEEGSLADDDYRTDYSNNPSQASSSNDNSDYYCEGADNYVSSYRDRFATYSNLEDLYDQYGSDFLKSSAEDTQKEESTPVAEAASSNENISGDTSDLIDKLVDEYMARQRVVIKQAIEQVLGLFGQYDPQMILNSLNNIQTQLSSEGNVAASSTQQAPATSEEVRDGMVSSSNEEQVSVASEEAKDDTTGLNNEEQASVASEEARDEMASSNENQNENQQAALVASNLRQLITQFEPTLQPFATQVIERLISDLCSNLVSEKRMLLDSDKKSYVDSFINQYNPELQEFARIVLEKALDLVFVHVEVPEQNVAFSDMSNEHSNAVSTDPRHVVTESVKNSLRNRYVLYWDRALVEEVQNIVLSNFEAGIETNVEELTGRYSPQQQLLVIEIVETVAYLLSQELDRLNSSAINLQPEENTSVNVDETSFSEIGPDQLQGRGK